MSGSHDPAKPSLDAYLADPSCALRWARARATGRIPGVDAAVVQAVDAQRGRLVTVAPAVVLAAVDAILLAPHVTEGLTLLARLGVLAVWLPEVAGLIDFHLSCPVHHKDLWAHTCAVIEKMDADADLRWAALMHDSGKIATRHVADGKVSFIRHEALGGLLMRGVAARLELPAARAERITFVIAHHGRVNAYTPGWGDNAVRRLVRTAGPFLDDLLSFSSADWTTKRTARAARIRQHITQLTARIAAHRAADLAGPALPVGLGGAIVRGLGIPPGPVVGQHLAWLTAQVDAGQLPPRADAELYIAALRARDA